MDNLGAIKSIKKRVHDKQIENVILEGKDNVENRERTK